MAKVSPEQRIQAVQRYLNGNEPMIEIAKDIGVSDQVVSEWVRRYQKNGGETFLKSYTKYSADYKIDVLNYMNETGTSSTDTAALFNISSPGMIRNWKIKFEVGGYDALVSKKKGHPSSHIPVPRSPFSLAPISLNKPDTISFICIVLQRNGTLFRIIIDLTAFMPFYCCGLYKVHSIIYYSLIRSGKDEPRSTFKKTREYPKFLYYCTY
ncbi:transposase [Lysinibacillus xylanilyticus]|uniref:transposase n=1 Tax=Lysinibacillus xylanilyticus TaxID=582475 RepID=UPI002E1CC445|nr:transposase [Lysinibacillus xylanilyticus]